MKIHEIKIGTLRKELAQWVARTEEGDVVVVLHYLRPASMLIAYNPGLIGQPDEPESKEPTLYSAYYMADTRHTDASRTIADVVARGSRSLANRLARLAMALELEEVRNQQESEPESESGWVEPQIRLVTLEEMERLAPVKDDKWKRDKNPEPPRGGGGSSAMNSGIKRGK